MFPALLTLTLLIAAQATYYPWQPSNSQWQPSNSQWQPSNTPWQPSNRWSANERSGEDVYPGTYLGEGSAMWHRGAAEMSCALNTFEGYVVSNIVWTKLRGNYEEPFYPCPYCYPMDDRIRAYNHMGKSILIIQNPAPMDQGIYRCTATAQYPDGRLTTIYQIVQLQ